MSMTYIEGQNQKPLISVQLEERELKMKIDCRREFDSSNKTEDQYLPDSQKILKKMMEDTIKVLGKEVQALSNQIQRSKKTDSEATEPLFVNRTTNSIILQKKQSLIASKLLYIIIFLILAASYVFLLVEVVELKKNLIINKVDTLINNESAIQAHPYINESIFCHKNACDIKKSRENKTPIESLLIELSQNMKKINTRMNSIEQQNQEDTNTKNIIDKVQVLPYSDGQTDLKILIHEMKGQRYQDMIEPTVYLQNFKITHNCISLRKSSHGYLDNSAIQILSNIPIKKSHVYRFETQIIRSFKNRISVGVVDFQQQKYEQKSLRSGNSFAFRGDGSIFYGTYGKYRMEEQNFGFKAGDSVETQIDLIRGSIKWTVNQNHTVNVTSETLKQSSRYFVPYWEFTDQHDEIKWNIL